MVEPISIGVSEIQEKEVGLYERHGNKQKGAFQHDFEGRDHLR